MLEREMFFIREKLKECETPTYRQYSGFTREQIQAQIKAYTEHFRTLLKEKQTVPPAPSPKWETVQLDPLYF